MRQIYSAVNEAEAAQPLEDFDEVSSEICPAIKNLWVDAWAEFVPFLDHSPEIRRVIYSTTRQRAWTPGSVG